MANKERHDKEANRILISEKMFALVKSKGRIPSMRQLAEATGLCEKTIERHLKDPTFRSMKNRLRSMNDMMLVQFTQQVVQSKNPQMWDMYWTLMEADYADVKSKKKVDVTTAGKSINENPTTAAIIQFNGESIEILK